MSRLLQLPLLLVLPGLLLFRLLLLQGRLPSLWRILTPTRMFRPWLFLSGQDLQRLSFQWSLPTTLGLPTPSSGSFKHLNVFIVEFGPFEGLDFFDVLLDKNDSVHIRTYPLSWISVPIRRSLCYDLIESCSRSTC